MNVKFILFTVLYMSMNCKLVMLKITHTFKFDGISLNLRDIFSYHDLSKWTDGIGGQWHKNICKIIFCIFAAVNPDSSWSKKDLFILILKGPKWNKIWDLFDECVEAFCTTTCVHQHTNIVYTCQMFTKVIDHRNVIGCFHIISSASLRKENFSWQCYFKILTFGSFLTLAMLGS